MLRNFVLKAGVEQSIGGVVRFVNLLASSEGYVTVRAKNKQGGIDLLSKLMNGDSFEFEDEITEVTIVTPKDAFVSIYVSHVKLVNNGVTVKAAGAIKTTQLNVSGKKKLNTITAQNQQIKIKALSGSVQILSEVGAGWPLAAGEKEEISTSGDVYAYKAPLVVQMEAGREPTHSASLTLNQAAKLHGDDTGLYLIDDYGSWRRVVNGAASAISGSVSATVDNETFSLIFSGSSTAPSACFFAGMFYFLWVRRTAAGNTALFVAQSADLSAFELVTAKVIGQQIVGGAENFGNGYLAADLTGAYLGYESTASGAGGSGSNFVALVNLASGDVSAYNVSTSYGAHYVVPAENAFYLVKGSALMVLDGTGFVQRVVLSGLTTLTKGVMGVSWRNFVIIAAGNGAYKINVNDGTHTVLAGMTGTQYKPLLIGDALYSVVSKDLVQFNLLTNIKTQRAFTYFNLVQGTASGALMFDGTDAIAAFMINGLVQSGDPQGTRVAFNPLLIQSGEVKAAKVAVMELF